MNPSDSGNSEGVLPLFYKQDKEAYNECRECLAKNIQPFSLKL